MTKVRWIPMAIAVLLLATVADAQKMARPGVAGRGGPQMLSEYLQLSDAQAATAKQIREDTAAAVKPLAEQAKTSREQLRAAVGAATPDPAAVGNLAISLQQTRDQIRALRQEGHDKFVALLTPDQKTKLSAFEELRKMQRRGPGRG